MTDIKVKRSLEKQTNERVAKCECLICGEPAIGPRGLCHKHYLAFRRELADLPKSQRAEFESELIKEGRVLASGQAKKIKKPSPFSI